MSNITRRKTLLELSIEAAAAGLDDEVRTNLDVYSTGEIDLISTLVATIRGDLDTLEITVTGLETDVATISGDLNNLFDTTSTSATSGAYSLPSNPEGFITISVGGVDKKIPYYGL